MELSDLSAAEAREMLDYDPVSGVITWRFRSDASASWNGRFAGKRAGGLMAHGYRQIVIRYKHYLEHRIAWLLLHGDWPKQEIDHINGCVNDNRACNLREASRANNGWNKGRQNSASGFKGVFKGCKRWVARITVHRRVIHLGTFDTPEEAHAAYCRAAPEWHGEFARTE